MRVVHTPNHRGFKGTEFLISAVHELQSEGVSIELQLIENRPNSEIREILAEHCDVLVEQLVFTGYGMSAVEGLASGVVVVSNLSDERIMVPFRRWSFLSECPIVSASPETIKEVLRKLSNENELRHKISAVSREYAEKYHSYDAFYELYLEIEKYLFGERGNLFNYYHPLIGEFGTKTVKTLDPPWNWE
jgi:glycosyltransferase involved in cell wall biosynthesis